MTCLFLLSMILLSTKLVAAPSDHFVTTWETTVGDTVITIPTFPGETYSYAIDWDNDMVPDQTGITGDATHDYGVAGVHTIRIFGDFPRIYINDSAEKNKILSIEQWGTNQWISMERSFYGASNLVNNAIDTPDLSIVSSLSSMFRNCGSIGAAIETSNWDWDTSNVSLFNHMFINASSFNQDISSWSTNNVTNMQSMFTNAISFNQDLSAWNVENISTPFFLFLNNTAFSTINYDKLLIAWSNQNLLLNSIFQLDSQYCSVDAQNARATIISNFNWTITDGGHTNACDVLFENSFENVIVVKSTQQQINYDFSKINPDTLGYQPELIIKGLDDNNKENMRIHIRNDLGVLQVRVSNLRDKKWLVQQWLTIENNKTITLEW